jgi:hypothetical protein
MGYISSTNITPHFNEEGKKLLASSNRYEGEAYI